jgi:hypothetical protein
MPGIDRDSRAAKEVLRSGQSGIAISRLYLEFAPIV